MGGFSRCVPDANRCVPRCVSVRLLKRIDVFLGADWCGYWGGIISKFMEMETLTAPMLRELIDHIDVYEKEGGKKNYTQRIVIYYRFVGYLELPSSEDENYKANTRKGVDVEYIPTAKSA